MPFLIQRCNAVIPRPGKDGSATLGSGFLATTVCNRLYLRAKADKAGQEEADLAASGNAVQ